MEIEIENEILHPGQRVRVYIDDIEMMHYELPSTFPNYVPGRVIIRRIPKIRGSERSAQKTIEVKYYRPGVYGVRPEPDNLNFEYLLPTEEMMRETITLLLKEGGEIE